MSLKFLEKFEKSLEDIDGIGSSSEPPRYWYSTGNYVLNRIISGDFNKGIPQGRITALAGPSSSGKSFLGANIVKNAQDAEAFALVIDSENALDDRFMQAIGVDTENNYQYISVTTIPQVTKVVSSFLQGYKQEHGTGTTAPKVLILIDSLDMLISETELEHFEAGDVRGDQGQRNKQLKQMLRTFVQAIKGLNISIVITSQVYKNQDLKNGEGVWIQADAVKYSASQIILLTKLKLKDLGGSEVKGIRMKAEIVKSRFSQPFQSVTIEVPYETGQDPLSGLIDVAVQLGIVEKRGSRYGFVGEEESWYAKNISDYAQKILDVAGQKKDAFLKFKEMADDTEDEVGETSAEVKAKRKKKVT